MKSYTLSADQRGSNIIGVRRASLTALLLFSAFVLCSCAGKSELTRSPVTAPVTAPAASESAPPVDFLPDDTERKIPPPSVTEKRDSESSSSESKAAPKVEAAAKTVSPYKQMLQSAGRDPAAAQPEPGFVLVVPEAIGDGEAFALEFAADGAEMVILRWRDKTVKVDAAPNEPGRFLVLLPVPLDEKSKSLPLSMTVSWANGAEETFKASLPIKKRKYPVQRLKVESKYVSPPASMQEKIKRDRAEMRAAVTRFSPQRYWKLPMLRPVLGQVTSLYGLRRVFNNVPKNPHKGVDFDAREGDPIAAAEDGVVVLVSEHYYGGNTVVVDHGQGVLSAYLHLSGFNVSEGQNVSRGDTIGYIGSTGRVTGPHLHLSLYVLGESVNAATCLDM